METEKLNKKSLYQEGGSLNTPDSNALIESLSEEIQQRVKIGEPAEAILYSYLEQGVKQDELALAFESIGYDPNAFVALMQSTEEMVNNQMQMQQQMQQMQNVENTQQAPQNIEQPPQQMMEQIPEGMIPPMQWGGDMFSNLFMFGDALNQGINDTTNWKNQKDQYEKGKSRRWEVDFKGADVNPEDYYVTSQGELRNFKDDKKNKTDSFKIDTTMDKKVVEYFDNINNKKKPFIEDFEYEDISKPPTNNKIPSNFDEWMTATHAANTPKGPTEMGEYGPVKKQSMLDLINYRYGGDLYKAQDGLENIPTTQDSLDLYNNAIEKEMFYRANSDYVKKKSETSNEDIPSIIEYLKSESDDLNEYAKLSNNEDSNTGSSYDRFGVNGNIASAGDILVGEPDPYFNANAPKILLHTTIRPQGWDQYHAINLGDKSDVPYYDPVTIYPKSMGDVPPEAFEFSDSDLYKEALSNYESGLFDKDDEYTGKRISLEELKTLNPKLYADYKDDPYFKGISVNTDGSLRGPIYENPVKEEPYVPNYDTDLSASLKKQGRDRSYTARKKLAEQAGITDYKGTAEQNIAMLKAEQARGFDETKPLIVEGYGNNTETPTTQTQTVPAVMPVEDTTSSAQTPNTVVQPNVNTPPVQTNRQDQVQYRKVLTGYDSDGKPVYGEQGYRAKGSNLGRDTTIQNEYQYGGQALPKAQVGRSIVTPIPTQPFSTIQPMNLIPGQRFDTDNLNGFINSTNVGNTGPGSGMGSMNLEQLNFNNLVNNTGVDYSANTPAIANSQLQNQQGVYASGQGSGMGGVNKEEIDMANLAKEYNSSQQTNTGNTTSNSNDFGVGEDVGAWEQDPTVKRKRTVGTAMSNAENWLKNNPTSRAIGNAANIIKTGAGVFNSAFNAFNVMNAQADQKKRMSAEAVAGISQGNRGQQDLNTGLFIEDKDIYGMSKYGSEIYRNGGNIKNWFEQNDIPRAQEGIEVEIDNDMLAALIAAGADIEML